MSCLPIKYLQNARTKKIEQVNNFFQTIMSLYITNYNLHDLFILGPEGLI